MFRKLRDHRHARIDPFQDPRGISTAARGFILDAEEQASGPRTGRAKLDIAATALAAIIDIPLLPEALEVLGARLVVQAVFGTIEDIGEAVRRRRARRQAERARS